MLEIGDTDGRTVYLRNRSETTSDPYFTLSHCWGSLKPIQLTAGTEASLRAGVSTDRLPKTFRDAIFIAIKFSVRYLWIDSVCIFQDSLEDWHREAAAMCDVYSHAICNVAATGASDGSVGLFFKRDSTLHCPFWVQMDGLSWNSWDPKSYAYPAGIYALLPIDAWEDDLEFGPLNHRAWVLQERLLSTRVMHFSASQVFWECLENSSGEVFPDALPSSAQPFWFYDPADLKRQMFQNQREETWQERLYSAWQVVRRTYSRCRLSKESDKLVAIAGVGRLLSQLNGDELLCGLWRGRLVQELCWRQDQIRPGIRREPFYPQQWRAPTWSWASTNVEAHPSSMRHHIDCSNLQIRATIGAIEVDAFTSGQLKHASLTLRGKPTAMTFIRRRVQSRLEYDTEVVCGSTSINTRSHDASSSQLILDNPDTEPDFRMDLVCLGMFACSCTTLSMFVPDSEDEKPTRYLEALALRPCEAGNNQYERVGMVNVLDSDYDFYTANETGAEHCLEIV